MTQHLPNEMRVPGRVPQWTRGERLRKAREDLDLTQSELAAAIEIGKRRLVAFENDDAEPKRSVILSWALRCGVDSNWLMTGVAGPEKGPGDDGIPSGDSRDTNRYPALRDVTGLTPGLRLAGEPPRSPLRLVPPRSPAPHGSADATEEVAA